MGVLSSLPDVRLKKNAFVHLLGQLVAFWELINVFGFSFPDMRDIWKWTLNGFFFVELSCAPDFHENDSFHLEWALTLLLRKPWLWFWLVELYLGSETVHIISALYNITQWAKSSTENQTPLMFSFEMFWCCYLLTF